MIKFHSDPSNKNVFVVIANTRKITRRGIRQGLYYIGKDIRATASENILKKPRNGRTYIRRTASGRRRKHIASVAGESFANASGRARRSLAWVVGGSTELAIGFATDKGDKAPYTAFLENGTSKIGARPTLKIAVDSNERNSQEHLIREVDKAFKIKR